MINIPFVFVLRYKDTAAVFINQINNFYIVIEIFYIFACRLIEAGVYST